MTQKLIIGGEGGVGIKMSWSEKNRKINNWGGGGVFGVGRLFGTRE